MAEQPIPATFGVDHVGLSVRDLESTRRFFCDCLGWRVVGERPDYPAAFTLDVHAPSFIHLDGDHSRETMLHDLQLASAWLQMGAVGPWRIPMLPSPSAESTPQTHAKKSVKHAHRNHPAKVNSTAVQGARDA